jgi:hypothetical protein
MTLDPSYGKKAVEWLRDHVISLRDHVISVQDQVTNHLEGCFPVPDDPDPGPPGSNVINLFFQVTDEGIK